MFQVIWQYNVPPNFQKQFEEEYGHKGTWAHFFGQPPAYKGSDLYKQLKQPDIYILVDKWESEGSYKAFTSSHKESYEALSHKFEFIYDDEAGLGTINIQNR